jgi:hypothetical protein
MNDTQLLERLTSAYATVAAPPPSATLAEILESGEIGESGQTDTNDEARRDAVVVPFVRPATRTRVRARHLVAACVASFVLFSGLAVAGALPGPVQRQVSSVVARLGIDLPSPESRPAHDTPATRDPRGSSDGHASTPTSSSMPTTAADGMTNTPASEGVVPGAPGVPSTTAPGSTGAGLGDVGLPADPTTPTTLPPGGGSLLPPLTVPQIPLPPPLPQISLPPLTLPQLTLPPLLPLPPLPLLGL